MAKPKEGNEGVRGEVMAWHDNLTSDKKTNNKNSRRRTPIIKSKPKSAIFS